MRYLQETLAKFAKHKFVLLSGPRQVGKTTMAKEWLSEKNGDYFNWDADEHKKIIIERSFLHPLTEAAFVFDEIHKYGRWKSWLKGLYDLYHEKFQAVVTGSARLDLFQKGGDSLLGRCEYLRLHPFSIGELMHGKLMPPPEDWIRLEPKKTSYEKWLRLERMSGFPEPYTTNDPLYYKRWSTRRRSLLVKEDIREITQVKTLSLVEHLAILLPQRVGSPLSVNALREELQVAHDTVSSWLSILERLYFCFRITSFHKKISRGLKKEQKLYLWDWPQVENPSARFENMVASHLLKAVHAWNDLGFGEYSLHFVRDKEKNEIDFVITERSKPLVFIECKMYEDSISLSNKLVNQYDKIPVLQFVSTDNVDYTKGRIRVVSAHRYLAGLV